MSPNTLVKNQWMQWLAVMCATMIMISVGTVNTWLMTNSRRLKSDKDMPVTITNYQESWLVLLTYVGSVLGSYFGVYLSDNFGRKYSLICAGKFLIAGWWVTIFTKNVMNLYVARTILGIGSGIACTTNPVYVSEVADTNIRGAVGSLMAINVFIGSLIAYSTGPYTILGIILLIIPIIFVTTFIWFPESPYFLAMKNEKVAATNAIIFFKNVDMETARKELTVILLKINKSQCQDKNWLFKMKNLFSYNNVLAFFIISIMIFMQHLSGYFITMQYLENILIQLNFNINEKFLIIIIKIICLIPLTVTVITIEQIGRRILLILSSFFCTVIQFILAIYFYFLYLNIDMNAIHLLPLMLIITFQLVYYIGLGVIPNLMVGEFFPTKVKSIASAGITVFDCSLGFLIFNFHSHIHYLFTIHEIQFLFAGLCFIGFIFILFCVPETMNKTTVEIQKELLKIPFKHIPEILQIKVKSKSNTVECK